MSPKQQTEHQTSEMSSQSSVEVPSDANAKQKNGGMYLRWSRLRKTVEVQDPSGGLMRGSIAGPPAGGASRRGTAGSASSALTQTKETKDILCGVSGYAAPGELLACMGPSGSGKTSLLNTLSGRSSFQAGVISVNGQRLSSASMKRLMSKTAYVKQADIFFEHLTVQDQLTYTALLRLPAAMNKADKHKEVQRIIGLLRLQKVAENQIFMCSGGEKKRVNIGTELLTGTESYARCTAFYCIDLDSICSHTLFLDSHNDRSCYSIIG